ncbi:hypothetical protein F5B22DRAFT_599283 [Xylaria bambusicola]|uniref:uncharacterized protein n=1 Tax=Xylaria bambusicola TaxID=326684 RepID=UPI0020077689|nr:uncharacterized protein F5B22DRAFT_599283 [Xylaria bambusicola]KAI0518461.1 hypothetical protein F5B22DRAFT_599283 [Xylaria bambusicola]
MNDFSQQEQPTSDTFDFSDNGALRPPLNPQFQPRFQPQPSRHGGGVFTVGSSDMAHIANVDRNEYSDEDIGIMYEIVVRAETILAEDLTPSTGLPIHALFLAYEEIIAEHGLDPSERHISKLVFMVGYIKSEKSIMDKFKAVMAQMNITLAIEEPPASDNGHGYREGSYAGSDSEDFRSTDDEHTSIARMSEPEIDDHRPSSENVPGLSTEQLNSIKETHLADTALAFEKQRHARSLAVATLRRWHNTAHYINYLRGQSDAIRRAELSQALADRFHSWRALAAEAAQAAPNRVPQNAYSKRTERIAIRAHDILLTKKALLKWRQSAQAEYRRDREAKLQAHRLAKQEEYEDEDFKDNPELARLAQRAHKNLVLSQAFTKWSNRVEEEAAKAEAASKAYEMSLKAKALGFARNRSAMDEMRKLLASKTNGAADSAASQTAASGTKQPEPAAPAVVKSDAPVPVASTSRPPLERPLSSAAITTLLQSRRNLAEKRPTSLVARPSTVIPIHTAAPTTTPIDEPATGTTATSASPVEPVPADKPAPDADKSDDEQPDERTMLARRHILRMRYFGAWERYTKENVVKVEQFEQENQDQHVASSVSRWRNETASRQQQAVECNIEFVQTQCYQRMTQIIPKWREKTSQEAYHRGKVLEHYAERAEYYQKITKSLPVLREKAGQAEQKEKLLRTYAERTNYYMRTTQALSIWRERAHEVSQVHQLHQSYGERADYYYRTRSTLSTWQHRAKQKRKERLREAHLETRRMVKKNMGERCIRQWREKLEPSYQRFEIMNVALVEALEDREWTHASRAFNTWRLRAQERKEAANTGEAMLKQKALEQWREKATLHRDLETEAGEHWEVRAKSRALRNWNLGSLQGANRPEMVANALEKKERRLLRQGFETWYGRTADKLVPVELPNGTYRNVGQVVEGAQHQAAQHQARGLLQRWKAAAADSGASKAPDEAYAPTPGRPQLFLGSYGGRETTTPLAPVPSYTRWQARDSTMGRSEYGARVGRSERTKNAKNLRVSWAT